MSTAYSSAVPFGTKIGLKPLSAAYSSELREPHE